MNCCSPGVLSAPRRSVKGEGARRLPPHTPRSFLPEVTWTRVLFATMHISIPDSHEIVESEPGTKVTRYLMYNIHINGTYHCSARYSTLKTLNDKFKKEFGPGVLET